MSEHNTRKSGVQQKTVWGVSRGDYSAYRVMAICDSQERAERIVGLLADPNGYGDADAEAFIYFDRDPVRVTTYSMSCEVWDNGTTSETRESVRTEWEMDMLWPERNVPVSWRWVRAPIHQNKGGRLEVGGTSRTRVAKVFSDRRAELLAVDAVRMRPEAHS